MAKHYGDQGPDCHKCVDAPQRGEHKGAHNHARGTRDAEDKRVLEFLHYLWDFFKECRVFYFLGCCAPYHVDAEHVAEKGLADVHREAADEDGHEEDPAEVLNH